MNPGMRWLIEDAQRGKLSSESFQSNMPTMRVAVAGTCGLALLIAQEIQESTTHQVIILSRIVSIR